MKAPLSIRRPKTVLLVAAIVTAAAAAGIPGLRFETDLRSLVGEHSPAAEIFFDLQDNGAANEALFLTVAAETPGNLDDAVRYAALLREHLSKQPAVKDVQSGLSAEGMAAFREFVERNLFLLLPPENVRQILDRLSDDGLAAAAREARGMLESAAPLATKELLLADPFALRELVRIPESDRMPRFRDGFVVAEDGAAVLLLVTARAPPTDGEESARFLAAVRGSIQATADRRPDGVSTDLAGGYLYAEAAEASVRGDLVRTLIPSILAVGLLFWLFFRSLSGLAIVGAPVLLALVVTMGAVGWLGIRITPVTAAFCALLVGLGVDFGIHLLVSINIEYRGGRDLPEAVARAHAGVSRGIVLGGLTTAGAVMMLAVADLPGLASLGLMLAIGVLVAMAGALTVSVAIVMLLRRSTAAHGGNAFAALGSWIARRRTSVRWATLSLVVLLAVTFAVSGLPPLSDDPGQLRNADDPPTLAILRLVKRFPSRMLSDLVAWRGTDLDTGLAALQEARRTLEEAGASTDWSGPGNLIPARPRQVEILGRLATYPTEGFVDRASAALRTEGLNPVPFQPSIEKLQRALAVRGPVTGAELRSEALRPLGMRFLVDTGSDSILVAYHRAPEETRARLGELLERIEPPVVATGPRALLEGIAAKVESEFRLIPLLVLATVLAATAIGFRSLRLALYSVAPVVLGMAMTLATMTWTGLPFNMINVGLIPMVLGLGVDDGIQFMNRLRHEGDRPIAETSRHVGGAILLTTLTTCAAFGSLVLSTNPGLTSMGYLVMFGALSCCAVTLLVLPALLPGRRNEP